MMISNYMNKIYEMLVSKSLMFVLVISFIYLIILLCIGAEYQLRVVADDYFYYHRIGNNFLHGLGCTFDGVVKSNGFQPLWQVAVIGFIWLSKVLFIDDAFFAIFFNLILFLSGLIYLYRKFSLISEPFKASLLLSIGAL